MILRRARLPVIFCMICWAATRLLAAQTSGTPEAIYHPRADYPIWISAKAAEEKSLGDPASFHPIAAERIRYLLAQTPVAGCQQAGPIINDFAGGRPRPRSLEDAARSYPIFGYGVVRELTPGFQVGEAGHLARVEVTEPSRGVEIGQSFFVFLPLGDFTFHGKKICKEDIRYAGMPAVGDELLVFVDRPDPQKERIFTIDYPEAVVWISGNEVKFAPRMRDAMARGLASAQTFDRAALLMLLPVLQAAPFQDGADQ